MRPTALNDFDTPCIDVGSSPPRSFVLTGCELENVKIDSINYSHAFVTLIVFENLVIHGYILKRHIYDA